MIDCTEYGDQELSLYVYNDQALYRSARRCRDETELRDLVSEVFHYTEDQFAELVADWRADLESD